LRPRKESLVQSGQSSLYPAGLDLGIAAAWPLALLALDAAVATATNDTATFGTSPR
jgi:hypothetical protein